MWKNTLTFVCAVALAFSATGTAEAALLGGKWPYGGEFTLYYAYGGGRRYNGNIYQGAANWTSTPTRVNIKQWPGNPHRIDLDIVDQRTSASWWGLAVLNPCNTCTYKRSTIYMNPNTLDRESDLTRTKVATHEFGHGFGLAHSGISPSIMLQGRVNYSKPQGYDITETNRWYPK